MRALSLVIAAGASKFEENSTTVLQLETSEAFVPLPRALTVSPRRWPGRY